MFSEMKLVLPDMIYGMFETTVTELFTRRYNVLLSVGFILSIFYASQGINTLLIAFNQSYQIELERHPIKQRLISLAIFFVMMLLFLSALSVSIFGQALANYIEFDTQHQIFQGVFNFVHFYNCAFHGNARHLYFISLRTSRSKKVSTYKSRNIILNIGNFTSNVGTFCLLSVTLMFTIKYTGLLVLY